MFCKLLLWKIKCINDKVHLKCVAQTNIVKVTLVQLPKSDISLFVPDLCQHSAPPPEWSDYINVGLVID